MQAKTDGQTDDEKERSGEDLRITPLESENTELVGGIQVPTEDSLSIAVPVGDEGPDDAAVPFPVLDRRRQSADDKSGSRKDEEPLSQIGDLRQFSKDVISEFKKISWPAGKEVAQATYSVIALVAILTLLVLGFDYVLSHFAFGPLEHWARLHGGGTGRAM